MTTAHDDASRQASEPDRVLPEAAAVEAVPAESISVAAAHGNRGAVAVTGGSSGIGRAVVRRMLADGHRVINVDRQAPPALLDGETWVEADLADADATRAVGAHLAREPGLLRLVNNAGIVRPATLEVQTPEDLAAIERAVPRDAAAGDRYDPKQMAVLDSERG